MPWSLHELSHSEGTQAPFCSNAEQGVSPLTCISPPHQLFCPWQCPSELPTAWTLLQTLSQSSFALWFSHSSHPQLPQGWQEPATPTFPELEVWHILGGFFCFPVLCCLCADIPARWGQQSQRGAWCGAAFSGGGSWGLCPVPVGRKRTGMNEKGQEKEGFGCTVPRALSLIHKQTYLGMWL